MPTGVGTALLISAAIGAGTSAVEAGIQSHQTNKAVGAQEKATDKAIAGLKPFQDTGTQAFQTLGSLMGLGGGGGGGAAASAPASLGGVTGPTAPPGMKGGAITDPNVQPQAGQAPGGGGWQNGASPAQLATNQTASTYPGYTPSKSPVSIVTMRGPDGSTAEIPGDQVGAWIQKGAVIVHG